MTDPARVAAVMAEKYSNVIVWPDWRVREEINLETVQVDGDSPILAITNGLWYLGREKRKESPPDGGPLGAILDDALHHPDPKQRRFLRDCSYLFDMNGASTIGWGDNPGYPMSIEESLDGLVFYQYFTNDFKNYVMSQQYVDVPKWNPLFTDAEVGTIRLENNYNG
jgi:hypothetical protein